MNARHLFWGFIVMLCGATASIAQEDMEGSADHPEFPRMSGSVIATYTYAPSDGGLYLRTAGEGFDEEYAEGNVTKLLYHLAPDHRATDVILEYITLFEETGTIVWYYSCSAALCEPDLSARLVWPAGERFPTPVKTDSPIVTLPDFMLRYPQWHSNVTYISGEVTNDTGRYIVSVYAAESTRSLAGFTDGQVFVDLQIIERADP